MPSRPTMTMADGRWSVEVITTRGGRHFRVKRLDGVVRAGSGRLPTGTLCDSIADVRALIGEEGFATLREDRAKRFDGGR